MDIAQSRDNGPNITADLKNDLIPNLRAISSGESKYSSLTVLIVTSILFFRKLSEEIQLLSQPYKTNYRHFAEQ
jgi:hypothetical protein